MLTKYGLWLWITEEFDPTLKKCKLSGTVTSSNSAIKTILAYDRLNAQLLGSTVANSDGTWQLYLAVRSDEQITVLCRDEGGDYNADVYDRVSLCTVTFVHSSEYDTMILSDEPLLIEYKNPSIGVVAPYSANIRFQDLKQGLVDRAVSSTPGVVEFRDSSDSVVTVGSGGAIPEIREGAIVNTVSGLVGDSQIDDKLDHRITVPDIFGDGSAICALDFADGEFVDRTGNVTVPIVTPQGFSSQKGKFGTCIGNYGPGTSYQMYQDLGFSLQDNQAQSISFWFNPTQEAHTSYPCYFFTHGFSANKNLVIGYHSNYGRFTVWLGNGTSWDILNSVYHDLPTSKKYRLKHWFHVAFVMDGSDFIIYVDGEYFYKWAASLVTSWNGHLQLCWPHTSISVYDIRQQVDMFRVFNRAITAEEVRQLRDEIPLGKATVSEISNVVLRDRLSLPGVVERPVARYTLRGHWGNDQQESLSAVLDNIKFFSDSIWFSGSGPGFVHELESSTDTGGALDESNIDITCKFKVSALSGQVQAIVVSGDSTDGIAIGFDSSNNLGVFTRSGGTLTSGIFTTTIDANVWYWVVVKPSSVQLYNVDLNLIEEVSVSISAGQSNEQFSVGAVCGTSPISGNTAREWFAGEVGQVQIFQAGTSELQFPNDFRLACEFGETGQQCYVESVTWDVLNKVIELWVKVPTLSATEDTKLRLYFDPEHEPNTDYVGGVGYTPAQNVWDSHFKAVYHMEYESGILRDSTGNGNALNLAGGSDIAGLIGRAINCNGTSDYASVSSSSLEITSGGLTYEAVLKRTAQTTAFSSVMTKGQAGSNLGPVLGIPANSDELQFGTISDYESGGNITLNDWVSVAGTWDGNTSLALYVSGVALTTTSTGSFSGFAASGEPFTIAAESDDGTIGNFLEAGLDEIRISDIERSADWLALTDKSNKDQLISYSLVGGGLSGWNKDQVLEVIIDSSKVTDSLTDFPVALILGKSVGLTGFNCIDVFRAIGSDDEYTKLLLRSNDPTGSAIFEDYSRSNHSITPHGGVHHDLGVKKIGVSSICFDGSGDYLELADSDDWNFGSEDFTIEWWEYCNQIVGSSSILDQRSGSNYTGFTIGYTANEERKAYMTHNGSSWDIISGLSFGPIVERQWQHIALVRKGDTFYAFCDGILQNTATSSLSVLNSSQPLRVANCANGAYYFNGYIDELRISKGVARWDSNFVPPKRFYASNKCIAVRAGEAEIQCPVEIEHWHSEYVDVVGGGTALSSSDFSSDYQASKAFDKDDSTRWNSDGSGSPPEWLKYDFGSGNGKAVSKIGIKAFDGTYGQRVQDFEIHGSNDDSTWVLLYSDTHAPGEDTQYYEFSNKEEYRYYRLTVLSNEEDTSVSIYEWELYESDFGAVLHTKIPVISDTENSKFYFLYDEAHRENLDYVGDTPDYIKRNPKKVHDLGLNDNGSSDLTVVGSPVDNNTYYTFNGNSDGLERSNDLGDSSVEIFYGVIRITNKNKGTAQVIWKDGGAANGIAVGIDASGNFGIFGRANNSLSKITIPAIKYDNDVWYQIFCTRTEVVMLTLSGKVVAYAVGSCTSTDGGDPEVVGCVTPTSPLTGNDYGAGNYGEFFEGDIDRIEIYEVGDLTAPKDGIVAQQVWDVDFVAVYHMAQNPSGTAPQILDSTSNVNHGTTYGSMTSGNLVDGLVGKALNFDGVDDYIDLGTDNSLSQVNIDWTVEGTIQLTGSQNTDWPTIYTAGDHYESSTGLDKTTRVLESWVRNANEFEGNTALTVGEYYNIAQVYKIGVGREFFIDGISDAVGSDISADSFDRALVAIGTTADTNSLFYGSISELRISKVARSDAWIKATNESLRDNLLTIQESQGASGLLAGWEEASIVEGVINSNDVPSAQTDFPVRVSITENSGVTNANLSAIHELYRRAGVWQGVEVKDYKFGFEKNGIAGLYLDNTQFVRDSVFRENHAFCANVGTRRLYLPDSLRSILVSPNLTISLWVRFSSVRNPSNGQTIAKGLLGSQYYRELSMYMSSSMALHVLYGTATNNYVDIIAQEISDFTAGLWGHIVFVRDAVQGVAKIYVNNVKRVEKKTTISASIGSDPLMIGDTAQSSVYPFDGDISDIMIFTRALSESEIESLYVNRELVTYKKDFAVTIFESLATEFPLWLGDHINSVEISGDFSKGEIVGAFTPDKGTYYAYTAGSWRAIASKDDSVHGVSGDTDWYYRDDGNAWAKHMNTPEDALAKAFKFPNNRMTASDINAFTVTEFNGLFDTAVGIFDLAVGLYADTDEDVTFVSNVTVNNTKYWVSEVYDLTDYDGAITLSSVEWNHTEEANFKVYAILTGDTQWTECVEGQAIPGITPAMTTVGKHLQFKVEFDLSIDPDPEDIGLKIIIR